MCLDCMPECPRACLSVPSCASPGLPGARPDREPTVRFELPWGACAEGAGLRAAAAAPAALRPAQGLCDRAVCGRRHCGDLPGSHPRVQVRRGSAPAWGHKPLPWGFRPCLGRWALSTAPDVELVLNWVLPLVPWLLCACAHRRVRCVEINRESQSSFEQSLQRLHPAVRKTVSWHCADASQVWCLSS